MLEHGTEQGRVYAAHTLHILVGNEGCAAERAVQLGAVEALLRVVKHSPHSACRKSSLRALARLVRNREAAARCMACAGHLCLLEALAAADEPTTRGALVGLYYLGADKNHIQQHLGAAGLVPKLLQLCHGSNPRIVYQAAQVLKMMTKTRYCGELILVAGGLATLQSLCNNSLDPGTREAACVALERLEVVTLSHEDIRSSRAKNAVQPYEQGMQPSRWACVHSKGMRGRCGCVHG